MNKTLVIAVVLVVVVAVAGFLLLGRQQTQDQTTTSETAQEQTAPNTDSSTIISQNFSFSPSTIKVKAGETVTFTNKDIVGHTVTSDDGKSFDTGLIGKDQSGTFSAPMVAGEYAFHCTPHPFMKGTLVVE